MGMSKPSHLCSDCLLGLGILLVLEMCAEVLDSSFVQLQGFLIIASIVLFHSLLDELCKQPTLFQSPTVLLVAQ